MKHLNPLTKREFLDTIYNYEKHPNEFVYIGKHPSMIIFSSPDNKFCVELEPALEIIAKRRKNHYNVYYVDTVREPELANNFITNRVPVIYLCPVTGRPTIVRDTINVKQLLTLADRLLKE